ncbi:MAG: branched-chain-amino-acid transaminase [Bacteroidota bacterium]
MTYYNHDTIIYQNGSFVKAADAKIDLYSQTMHYGLGVFEGIRSYKLVNGETRVFKAFEHYERLERSAKALNLPYHWNTEDLIVATYEVLEKNNLQDAYIRPLIYCPANMSFSLNTESFITIQAWEMAPFLGDKLLRIMTSTFQRPNPKGFKIEAKACGHYVNSILASQEAKTNGYDEAMLLDINGFVAEGPGANIFIEKDGILITPPAGNILPGLTRAAIFDLCAEYDIPVAERFFTAEEMKKADSAFYCGTAAEVIGVQSVDETIFPVEWNATKGAVIQKAYLQLVKEPSYITSLIEV